MVDNVASFGENVLALGELQARLAAVEIRQNVDSIRMAGAVGIAGLVVVIAALPVILTGIAEMLMSEMGLRRGPALLSVGALAVVFGGIAVTLALSWVRRKPLGFPLSQEEFRRNLNWIRAVLSDSGRSRR